MIFSRKINVCMVGCGNMAIWHTQTLNLLPNVFLHTIVSHSLDVASDFAKKYNYKKASASLSTACEDPEIDAVIIASPDDLHEEQAIIVLNSGKHLLLETPIAMSLEGTIKVLSSIKDSSKIFSVCHQMRFSRKDNIYQKILNNEEKIKHISIRYVNNKKVNISALGKKRSWRDTILWHHFCHFVDLGLWLLNDPVIKNTQGYLSPLDKNTNVPMQSNIFIETDDDRTLLIDGSYNSSYRIHDELIITDKETYLFDVVNKTLKTSKDTIAIEGERINIAKVVIDFISSIVEEKSPFIMPQSLLSTMTVLQKIQNEWNNKNV
jgi:2-hydroxy-4-carboxymuconate semialdehyde hemiacetal dehydrogenase